MILLLINVDKTVTTQKNSHSYIFFKSVFGCTNINRFICHTLGLVYNINTSPESRLSRLKFLSRTLNLATFCVSPQTVTIVNHSYLSVDIVSGIVCVMCQVLTEFTKHLN